MKILKENEEYLDKTALEILKIYMERALPTSDKERIMVSTAAYKQALAMLNVKLGLEPILNKTNYLVHERILEKKDFKNE